MIDRKQRLFEMMNRVAGMQLSEIDTSTPHSDLPPGFSDSDFESLSDFAHSNMNESDDYSSQKVDINTMVGNKMGSIENKKKQNREEPYLHKATITKILDQNGTELDLNRLRALITERPIKLLSENVKTGKNNILKISLPSYKGLFYNEKNKDFEIVNTCPNAGVCKAYCFANQGGNIIWENSSLSKSRILNFLLNHWEAFKYKVIDEIEIEKRLNVKRGLRTIVRWHDSGDFLSQKYLEMAFDIARETPDVLHYAYTKMVSNVKSANVPQNFVFSFSVDQEAPENDLINLKTDKHAIVVPTIMFKDLTHTEKENPNDPNSELKFLYNTPTSFNELKNRMAKQYDIDINTIISFNQLMKIPEGGEQKWNVIVTKKDGDMAAARRDVLGSYLLQHK